MKQITTSLALWALASVLTGTILAATSRVTPAPGEGLWRPRQIALPGPVERALRAVVRIQPRDMRFQVTVLASPALARKARRAPGALEKKFAGDGATEWPVILSSSQLGSLCSRRSAVLSPGIHEICAAFRGGVCRNDPCQRLTQPVASSAGGVAVARLASGMDVILTAYHVAREAIEHSGRTGGQYTLAPVRVTDLVVSYSRDVEHPGAAYTTPADVFLLANASEKDWHEGKDWALIGVRASQAPGLLAAPLARKPPADGDPVWIFGFPFLTARDSARVLGYADASGDLRVSYGLAVGAENLGANPPYVVTNADIVSGDSGGPLLNAAGEVLGVVHNSLCKPDGEIDLGTVKFCGVTLGTRADMIPGSLLAQLR